MTHEQQTFREHLQELSKRLRIPAALFAVGMLAGFIWYKPFSHLLTKPLGETLYFTSPTGGLNYMMFISLVLGLAVALPAGAIYSAGSSQDHDSLGSHDYASVTRYGGSRHRLCLPD
jgi:Sec-independent protein secretion pathway component TatC